MQSSLLRLPRLRRALGRDANWAVLWVSALVALEAFGRWSRSDTSDLAGVAVLVTLVLVTWREHSRRPLKPVGRFVEAAQACGRRLAALRFETGIDLRGDPPLPRAVPRVFRLVVGAAAAAALAAAALAPHFPTAAREAIRSVSAAGYLVLLGLLWAALAAGTVTGLVLPIVLAREAIRHSLRWPERRARHLRAGASAGYVAALFLATTSLPGWVPLALLVACLAAATVLALVAREPRLDVVWRASGPDATPYAMAWSSQALTQAWLFGGLTVSLVLLARGDRLAGPGTPETTITALAGLAFAWTSAGVFGVLVLDLGLAVYVARRRNPALRIPTRLRFENPVDLRARRHARRALEDAGFRVAFDDEAAGSADVRLTLRAEGDRSPIEETRGGPLLVRADELDLPGLHERLRRRGEIVRRRRLMRGLERLFKASPRRAFRRGTGTWVAPHLWFITRMSRDVEEEDELLSGPPYHPTIPIEARSHLFEVLRAVEIDIVFVEDGVGFRRLQRVLRMVLEYYDLFGGTRRAEDRQFVGLPGVRVVIHEHDLERGFSSSVYPEPDYEDLGRARILHVFRDRGEDAPESFVPSDADLRPVPAFT